MVVFTRWAGGHFGSRPRAVITIKSPPSTALRVSWFGGLPWGTFALCFIGHCWPHGSYYQLKLTVGYEGGSKDRENQPRKTGGRVGSYSVALLSVTERSGVELTMQSDPRVVGWEMLHGM